MRQVLGNRVVQRVTRVTGTLSVPMMSVGLIISDSGRRPAEVWEIIGFAGVALALPSIPPQVYYWFMRLSGRRGVIDHGDVPNSSQLSRWRERRRVRRTGEVNGD